MASCRSPVASASASSFGKIPEVARMPNLIEVQKDLLRSLSADRHRGGRPRGIRSGSMACLQVGLSESGTFRRIAPSSSSCQIRPGGAPKYDVEECQQRGMTYAAPLKVTLRLVVWDVDEDTGAQVSIRDIKEQDVYMGDMPLMTPERHLC